MELPAELLKANGIKEGDFDNFRAYYAFLKKTFKKFLEQKDSEGIIHDIAQKFNMLKPAEFKNIAIAYGFLGGEQAKKPAQVDPKPQNEQKKVEDEPKAVPKPQNEQKKVEDEPKAVPKPQKEQKKVEDEPKAVPKPQNEQKKVEDEPKAVPKPQKEQKKVEDEPKAVPKPQNEQKKVEDEPKAVPKPQNEQKKVEDEPKAVPKPQNEQKKVEEINVPIISKIPLPVEEIPKAQIVESDSDLVPEEKKEDQIINIEEEADSGEETRSEVDDSDSKKADENPIVPESPSATFDFDFDGHNDYKSYFLKKYKSLSQSAKSHLLFLIDNQIKQNLPLDENELDEQIGLLESKDLVF